MSPARVPDLPPGVDPRVPPAETTAAVAPPEALRPAVAGAGVAPAPWLAGGGALFLGLLVFLWLSAHRLHPAAALPSPSQAADAGAVAAPPPPADVDAEQAAARAAPHPAPQPPAIALVTPPRAVAPVVPPPVLPPAAVHPAATGRAPVLVVDLAGGADDQPQPAAKPGAPGQVANGIAGLSSDERFAARIESGAEPERTHATMIADQADTIAEGTIIPAVLETALNSDLPGFARALVSRDVRGFDGSTVLIPRGSRVVGTYKSALALGQSRVFVVWTRVLRPDGGSIEIGSGGGDMLGRAGLAGKVDRHFFERFSGAVLLTVLNAAAYAAAGTPSTEVSIGSTAGPAVGGAAGGLAPTDIPPTIKVAQGSPIRIFVQRDLDFAPVGGVGR